MTQLSSSFTLALAVFFPTVWFTFFGALNVMLWITEPEDISDYYAHAIRLAAAGIFFIFGLAIYFSVMRLRRVELELDNIFITNYFKTIQVHLQRVACAHLHFNKLGVIHLKSKTVFGSKIYFLTSPEKFQLLTQALQQHQRE